MKMNDRLRIVRNEHGYTQEELADKMNVSQKTISSWETGRTSPKFEESRRLCELYGCTLEYLTGTKQHDSNDITIDDVMFKMKSFDVETLKKISDYADFLIEERYKYKKIMEEKEYLEKQLQEYERQLSEFERR